jgi:hypothetical protein
VVGLLGAGDARPGVLDGPKELVDMDGCRLWALLDTELAARCRLFRSVVE